MKKLSHIILLCITAVPALTVSAEEATGLRGDPAAIADARAMVEAMGGLAIWRDTASVHFVHEWDFVNRPDRYLEHEILDLTGPRSYVTMDSEIYSRTRAYSPEHGRWSITNGEFARDGEESLTNSLERAPYSIYRLARTIGRDDGSLEVRYGTREGLPGVPCPGIRGTGRRTARLDHRQRPQGTDHLGNDTIRLRVRPAETLRQPQGTELGNHERRPGALRNGVADRQPATARTLPVRGAGVTRGSDFRMQVSDGRPLLDLHDCA